MKRRRTMFTAAALASALSAALLAGQSAAQAPGSPLFEQVVPTNKIQFTAGKILPVINSLSLPAGTYAISGSAWFLNKGTSPGRVKCRLAVTGASGDSNFLVLPSNTPGKNTSHALALPFLSTATLPSGGTAALRCGVLESALDRQITVHDIHLVAKPVASVFEQVVPTNKIQFAPAKLPVIASLSLPAGSYAIAAKTWLLNVGSVSPARVACKLEVPGSASVGDSNLVVVPSNTPVKNTAHALAVPFASTANLPSGGTVALRCGVLESALDRKITAHDIHLVAVPATRAGPVFDNVVPTNKIQFAPAKLPVIDSLTLPAGTYSIDAKAWFLNKGVGPGRLNCKVEVPGANGPGDSNLVVLPSNTPSKNTGHALALAFATTVNFPSGGTVALRCGVLESALDRQITAHDIHIVAS